MTAPNDGGPAFPQDEQVDAKFMDEMGFGRTKAVFVARGGMTLRDYFAAKAMAGFIGSGFQTKMAERFASGDRAAVVRALAELAGEVADAMLVERAKART